MDKFTAPLLLELIDRIDVYEFTGMGKNRKQQIWIRYKFVGGIWSLRALRYSISRTHYPHNKKSRRKILLVHTKRLKGKKLSAHSNSQVGYEHSIWSE